MMCVREGRMCPKEGGKIVGTDKCESCKDYREKQNHFVCENPCRYYINHPAPKRKVFPKAMEMYKQQKEIEEAKKKAAHFYKRSWPKLAEKIENEILHMNFRLRELEEEKRQWEEKGQAS